MPVTWQTYERVALEDPEGNWELHHGRLRQKWSGTFGHNAVMHRLGFLLMDQLDQAEFEVRINLGRVRCSAERYRTTCYVPDVFVLPTEFMQPLLDRPDALEVYVDPLPLVAEVWDPPIESYDTDAKIPEYRQHGDREIWRLHPFERTLTALRRQPDGAYDENVYSSGTIEPIALPGVSIDLDALFAS